MSVMAQLRCGVALLYGKYISEVDEICKGRQLRTGSGRERADVPWVSLGDEYTPEMKRVHKGTRRSRRWGREEPMFLTFTETVVTSVPRASDSIADLPFLLAFWNSCNIANQFVARYDRKAVSSGSRSHD